DLVPPGIEDDDDDSKRDVLILEEFPSNYSLSLLVNESFHFDIPTFSRPPAKPTDDDLVPPGIEDDDDDSKRDVLILEEFPSNFQAIIPTFSRPPAKPTDGDTGISNIKMMGDVSDQKIPACCDDDDDDSAITPNEPIDSLCMGDEHLNTIPATKSNEFIKSCVENLVPNPSESEGESECDMPAREEFTTFSNILFNADYEFDSSDDQSFSDEDVPEKIFSNPLFKEEIIPIKIDQHHDNVESTHDSSLIISSKIDSLLNEFAGELTLLKAIPPGIDKTDCHHENEIRLTKRLLYDNSSPRPPEEFVYENSNADIESFSPSPIPVEDSDSRMEGIDLSFNPDDLMPPGIEEDDDDFEKDILILKELPSNYSLSLPVIESFYFDIPLFYRPPAKPPDGNT
nr:hypothetical protein [Tanacetum cinerariifolium]